MTQHQMIESMYKILITGNGQPPLPEQVRTNTKDIDTIKNEKLGKWLIRIFVGLNAVCVFIFTAIKIFEKLIK